MVEVISFRIRPLYPPPTRGSAGPKTGLTPYRIQQKSYFLVVQTAA